MFQSSRSGSSWTDKESEDGWWKHCTRDVNRTLLYLKIVKFDHWPITLNQNKSDEIFLNLNLARGYFCSLLIAFANSLEPDQDQQNVGPDLDPNSLTLLIVILKEFLKKLILKKKSQQTTTKAWKFTQYPKS